MGAFEEALTYSDRSIKLARDLRDPYAEAASFHYRGIIEDQRGQWEAAMGSYSTARRIAESARDMLRVYMVKFMEARAYQMHGEVDRGSKLGEESVALASQIGTSFLLGQAKSFLAACRIADSRIAEARSLCEDAVMLAEKAGDRFTRALALRTLAEALCRANTWEERDKARQAAVAAVAIFAEIGARPELGRGYCTLACSLKAQGRSGEATIALENARSLFEQLGMTSDIERALHVYAEVARPDGLVEISAASETRGDALEGGVG